MGVVAKSRNLPKRFLELYKDGPLLKTPEFAKLLGCSEGYVRGLACCLGVKLQRAHRWPDAENDLLRALCAERLTRGEIYPHFPHRTPHAVSNQMHLLKIKPRIKPSNTGYKPAPLRPIIVEGDIARITLHNGMQAVIDAEDAPLVQNSNWLAREAEMTWYAYRRATANIPGCFLHRLILRDRHKPQIDHVDNDGLNNRRANLRYATALENSWNRRKQARNKTGFKGVFKEGNRWRAYITLNGQRKHLGFFTSPESAADAYDAMAESHFGEFAKLNNASRQ